MLDEWVGSLESQDSLKKFVDEAVGNTSGGPGGYCGFEGMKNKFKQIKNFNEQYNPEATRIEEITLYNSLGELYRHGVPIFEGLKGLITSFEKFDREEPAGALKYIHDAIRQGDTFIYPMVNQKFFSRKPLYAIAAGEVTGDMDESMGRAADILQDEVRYGLTPEQVSEHVRLYGHLLIRNAGLSEEQANLELDSWEKLLE